MNQAVILESHGGPDVLRLAATPLPPPSDGEVTISHRVVGINVVDLHYRSGAYPHALPHGLGFEAAGVIECVGRDVAGLRAGDRVAYATGPLGAYAQARNLPARHVIKLPPDIGFDAAMAILYKGLSVQYLFRQAYRLQAGETVLFHAAASGIGLLACQWARLLGVKLIGTVHGAAQASLAREQGAWRVVDTRHEDAVARVMMLTDGAGVAAVYDGVGRDTWTISLACLRPRGLLVSFDDASGPVAGVALSALQPKSLYLAPTSLAAYLDTPRRLQAAAAELFKHMRARTLHAHIPRHYPLSQAGQAHAELEKNSIAAAVLIPG
ncbi:quinone oxidoreductase family protein [Bordetella petrii]|uniref:quinone oxidoreductase family protein n=1 Tax=Bordetella petrii TaxID=94624 RepID=UPI001E298DDD|nr:quinone oxidoreductase [Bordetella petrii]MCD0501829.1 quinone oxidoreductase [Bordetella petrii]